MQAASHSTSASLFARRTYSVDSGRKKSRPGESEIKVFHPYQRSRLIVLGGLVTSQFLNWNHVKIPLTSRILSSLKPTETSSFTRKSSKGRQLKRNCTAERLPIMSTGHFWGTLLSAWPSWRRGRRQGVVACFPSLFIPSLTVAIKHCF